MKVINFYTHKPIIVKDDIPILMEDNIFYIMIKVGELYKELSVPIKAGFTFCELRNNNTYEKEHLKVYSILIDYLTGIKRDIVRENLGLTVQEYHELLFEIDVALIRNFSCCNWFKKTFLLVCSFIYFHLIFRKGRLS